jgi:hypothetical protein
VRRRGGEEERRRDGETERGRDGERERRREGERERGREGERERGREGDWGTLNHEFHEYLGNRKSSITIRHFLIRVIREIRG